MAKYDMGDQTSLMFDKILACDYHTLLSEQEMQELSELYRFEKGVIDRICYLGYEGDTDDIEKIVDYIVSNCKKHKVDLSRQTIKNWFDDINPNVPEDKKNGAPTDSEQSRPNVYKLCFALEMTAEETEEFFLKNYMCMPFNYKNTYEAVFYFCLHTGRSYETALKLLQEADAFENEKQTKTSENVDARLGETRALGIALSEIFTEEDFINYLQAHIYNKQDLYYTATRTIFGDRDDSGELITSKDGVVKDEGLLSKCKTIAAEELKLRGSTVSVKLIRGLDPLLYAIYGYDKRELDRDKKPGLSKESAFPKLIKKNFPHRQHFSQIEKKTATADIYKKVLTILCFYEFYGKLTNEALRNGNEENIDLYREADSFEIYLDELLDQCGFVQVYYQNPFDWLIMYCANTADPLGTFRRLIKKYYLDIIDEESFYE